MKQKLLSLVLIFLVCSKTFAQDFYGFVKKTDTLASPIYQANVDITEAGKPFKSLKTYFDGGFKFTPNKDQAYTVKISFDGYKDTTYSFTTDKKGVPSLQNVTVRLKKDGMRLLGSVKSKSENFPIKDVTLVLKNVMTRKEDRQTTGIDGRYNFKLEYETNYKVSIDKRSTGVFNKYKDTSFYVSTIGFNQPLDYKLDIALDDMLYATTSVREGYNAAAQPNNSNVKPVIAVGEPAKQPFIEKDAKLKSAQDANAKLLAELEKAKKEIEELKARENEKKSGGGGLVGISQPAKKQKTDPHIEVVVIRDNPVPAKDTSLASIAKQKEQAEARARGIEKEIALQQAEENIRLAAEEDVIDLNDPNSKVKGPTRAHAVDPVPATQPGLSAADIARAEQERVAKEQAAKRFYQDSVNKAAAIAKVKHAEDSIARAKADLAAKQQAEAKVKAEKERVAKELAAKKAYEDSVSKAAAAARAKFVADSVNRVKAELAAKEKEKQDSLARVKAEAAAARAKFVQDSIATAKAELAAKQQAEAQAKAEKERAAKELAAKKAYEDSVSKAAAAARAKFVADSVNRVKAELAAREKEKQDSLARVKAEAAAVRAKFVQDSIATAKAELAAKQQAEAQAKAEKERAAKELAAKKAYEDSVSKAAAAARAKFVADSTAKAKAEQARIAKEVAAKKAYEDSVSKAMAAARAKFVADSITRVKAELAAKEKEKQDSLARVKAEASAARARFVQDSIATAKAEAAARELVKQEAAARAKAEQERAEKAYAARRDSLDAVNRAAAIARTKLLQDSIDRVKAELAAKEKEKQEAAAAAAAKKAYQDSITRANALAEAKALQDSVARIKAEKERVAREVAEQKRLAAEQATRDSLAAVQAQKEKKAAAEALAREKAELERAAKELEALKAKARQDSIAAVARENAEKKRLAAEQATRDSIATAKAQKEKQAAAEALAREQAALEKAAKELAALKAKATQDSIAAVARETAEKKRLAVEQATRDSIANAQKQAAAEALAREKAALEKAEAMKAKARQDSLNAIAREKADRDIADRRIEQQALEATQKRTADSIARVQAAAQARLTEERAEKQRKEEAARLAAQQATTKQPEPVAADISNEDAYKSNTSIVPSTQLSAGDKQADYGVLSAVLFNKNEFMLSEPAKAQLKAVAQKLVKAPFLVMNIYAFASGDEANAKQISLRRSDVVLRFLIDNGVAIEQVKSFYYGNSLSRNGCSNPNCPEGLQQQNRAVAYQIVTQ